MMTQRTFIFVTFITKYLYLIHLYLISGSSLMNTANRSNCNSPCVSLLLALVLVVMAPFLSALRAGEPLDPQALVYDDGMGGTLDYWLFLPPGHDTPGAEFSLVLSHHGGTGPDDTPSLPGGSAGHIDNLIDATQSERTVSVHLAANWDDGHALPPTSGRVIAPSQRPKSCR
jgi:hypothetical protein